MLKSLKYIHFYISQLHEFGLKNVEMLNITSESGFYYNLLFCCRTDVEAKWLKMIEYYRNERFKNWTDSDVKWMWDVAKGIVKSLDQYYFFSNCMKNMSS